MPFDNEVIFIKYLICSNLQGQKKSIKIFKFICTMKKFLLFAMIASIGLGLFSCSKDEVNPIDEGNVDIPDQFSELTVEQNKTELEKNGQELLTDLDGMKDLPVIDVTSAFNDFTAISEPQTGGRIIESTTGFDEQASVGDVFTSMRSLEDEFTSLQQLFDEYAGTYTWNTSTETWDFVANSEKVEFLFPGTSTGTTNDAKILIHSYTSITGPNPLGEDYTGDLPTQVKVDVTYQNENILAYAFNASYNDNGEPTSMNTSLTMSPYSFEVNMTNTLSQASAKYTLTKSGSILISMGAGAEGQFTEAAYEENYGEGVVNTANAFFRLKDITLAGNVNVANIETGLDEIYADEADENHDSDEALNQEVKLYNDNFQLVAFYNSSKSKIAESEFYSWEKEETYDSGYFDENGNWVDHSYTIHETHIDLRLIFSDGSKSDMETYFNTGFEDITTDLEAFFEDLENQL